MRHPAKEIGRTKRLPGAVLCAQRHREQQDDLQMQDSEQHAFQEKFTWKLHAKEEWHRQSAERGLQSQKGDFGATAALAHLQGLHEQFSEQIKDEDGRADNGQSFVPDSRVAKPPAEPAVRPKAHQLQDPAEKGHFGIYKLSATKGLYIIVVYTGERDCTAFSVKRYLQTLNVVTLCLLCVLY